MMAVYTKTVVAPRLRCDGGIRAICLKKVERILLDRISHFLETWPNQFGFKPNLGTDTYMY